MSTRVALHCREQRVQSRPLRKLARYVGHGNLWHYHKDVR